MDLGIENKVSLVVNSHLTITTAVAISLAREGSQLALSAPKNSNMRHVEMELARLHISQESFRGMIADPEQPQDIRRLVRETLHRQGDIGILVNAVQNNGHCPDTANPKDEDLHLAFSRSFFSTVHLVNEVIPHMKRLREGRIINILPLSSLSVSSHGPLASASAASNLAYFKTLASKLAPCHITVNNVIYGDINSEETLECFRQRAADELGPEADDDDINSRADDILQEVASLIPSRRMAEPHEIGDIICMIASRQASYLTGANIIIDGGLHHTYL